MYVCILDGNKRQTVMADLFPVMREVKTVQQMEMLIFVQPYSWQPRSGAEEGPKEKLTIDKQQQN